MALTIAVTATENERLMTQTIEAMFGAQPGYAILSALAADADASSPEAVANGLVAFAGNTETAASFAASVVANLGITEASTGSAAAVTEAVTFVEAQLNTAGEAAWGAAVMDVAVLFSGLEGNATYGTAANAYNDSVEASLIYSLDEANQAPNFGETGSSEFNLTTGLDSLMGTIGDDSFIARIVDNGNTAQSGDVIYGGEGNDTLTADIGNSQNFAVTLETKSVENAIFRVQAEQNDSGDNNIAGVGIIDAERMSGVTNWENSNSRADLIVEDVRIADNQITKDITITMRETDPGHVDYGVYFDQNSLRNQTESKAQMNLRVLDTYAVAQGRDALADSPYGSFSFNFSLDGGNTFSFASLASDAMQDAQTLNEMVVAMQAAVDLLFGENVIAVSLGGSYTVSDSVTGALVSGNEIVLKAESDVQFDVDDSTNGNPGWLATETVPATSGLHTNFSAGGSSTTDLVTSTVVLDYVGRGSMGGDLVIGGLSVGNTSDSQGVQHFDINVEDDSELQTITSTNNALEEVVIVNGTQDRHADAFNTFDAAGGKLVVNGVVGSAAGSNVPLPSATSNTATGAAGFTDVRLVDASAMTGSLEATINFSAASVDKYVDLVDIAANPTADNIKVDYKGGSNNDKLVVNLDSGATASNSNFVAGREDFEFTVDGNAGNDTLITMIGDGTGTDTDAWYVNQKINANLNVNGGAGNDTITTSGAGDAVIDAGTGNDTVYADNTGTLTLTPTFNFNEGRATFVFNAVPQAGQASEVIDDLQSNALQTVMGVNVGLTVEFMGITTDVSVVNNSMGALSDVAISDLHINQAIKDAINSDEVLNKLIIAEDGPANTLIVRSLIDGVMDTADLTVNLADYTVATAGVITTAELAAQAISLNSSVISLSTIAADYATTMAADTAGIAAILQQDTITVTADAAHDGDETLTITYDSDGSGGIVTGTVVLAAGTALTNMTNATTIASDAVAALNADLGFSAVAVATSALGVISITYNADDVYGTVAVALGGTVAGLAAAGATSVANVPSVSGNLYLGADSTAVSDNTITGGTGDDVIVLGTDATSNDTVVFEGSFGNDTIVNFETNAGVTAASDLLDFTDYLTSSVATTVNTGTTQVDSVVSINTETAANDTASEIAALYNVGDTATSTAVQERVYIAYDTDNVASVYDVVDGLAVGDTTVTLVGTIHLAQDGTDTNVWSNVAVADLL